MLTRRDRAVIGGLLLALVLLSVGSVWPRDDAAGAPGASASPSPIAAHPYTEGILGRPTSVSPFGARTAADRALVALVFSGLVRLGPGETFVPDLAERWTVDDAGATYTFTLRDDARWHDGEPVTSADVAFTIAALQDPDYDGPGATSWRGVTVTTPDDRTVRFQLADPIGGFLVLATQPIAPAHLLEGIPPADLPTNPFGQRPIGSGPYRLIDWNANMAELQAAGDQDDPGGGEPPASPPVDSLASPTPTPTPDRPLPYLDQIRIRFAMDPAELASAYRAGQLDAVSGLAPVDAAALADEPATHLLRYPRSTLTAVVFDQRAGRPEFRDPRTRMALLQAIDRDAIVADQLAGLATRADALIPPTSWAFDATASPPIAHDAAAAAKGLKDAGWTRPSGGGWAAPGSKEPYHLELLSPDRQSNPAVWAVATAVADDWKALGLDAVVVGLDPVELVESRLQGGDFAAAVLDVGVGLDPDLYPLLASSQTVAGGSNVSGIQDPDLDARLATARQPGTDEARTTAYKDLQTYLAERTFIAPIAWRDEVVVARDTLTGPTIRRLGEAADRFYDVLTWRLADDR